MKKYILMSALGWGVITAWAGLPVEINQASEIDLDGLRGIGPAMSRQVLAERQSGAYASWRDLMRRVKGLGERKARALSDEGLRVNGQAYPGAATAAAK